MAVSVPASLPTVAGLLLARAGSPEPGLAFEDRRWSWQEHVSECARYAAALRARRTPGRPFHVGVLADNVPEFSFLLGGCAFAVLATPERADDADNPLRLAYGNEGAPADLARFASGSAAR